MKTKVTILLLLCINFAVSAAELPPEMTRKILKRFPQADTNGDGKLSPAEQKALSQKALKKYPQADTDGDGVLSKTEKQALMRKAIAAAKNQTPPSTDIPTTDKGGEPILPVATNLESHGLTQVQIDSLAKKFRHAVTPEQIAGCSFLIAHKGEIVFRRAFGYADIESKRPFTNDELCPIASVSKPVAASVMMALVEQGKLKLDDPAAKYLPELQTMKVAGNQSPSPFTIRQLLSHTAGFWGNKNISAEQMGLIRNFDQTLADSVSAMPKYDLQYQPGKKFLYSGAGYCVAGRVAEVALNQSFEEIAQDVLFRPLGLKRTGFLPGKEMRETMPSAYQLKGGQLEKTPSLGDAEDLRFILVGGSLSTTMDELAVIGQMHLNHGEFNGKQILSAESLAEMRRLQSPQKGPKTYGLGWFRGGIEGDSGLADLTYHNGSLGSHMRVDHGREVVTVFLIHQSKGPFGALKDMRYQAVNEMFPIGSKQD